MGYTDMNPEGPPGDQEPLSQDNMAQLINDIARGFGSNTPARIGDAALRQSEHDPEIAFESYHPQLLALSWELTSTLSGGGDRSPIEVMQDIRLYDAILLKALATPRYTSAVLTLFEDMSKSRHYIGKQSELFVRQNLASLLDIHSDRGSDSHLRRVGEDSTDWLVQFRAARLLFDLYSHSQSHRHPEAASFVAKHFFAILERQGIQPYDDEAIEGALMLLKDTEQEGYSLFVKDMRDYDTQHDPHAASISFLERICARVVASEEMTDNLLAHFNLDGATLRAAWEEGCFDLPEEGSGNTKHGYRRDNLRNILLLESSWRGASRKLHDTLNIRHFSRYPLTILMMARDMLDNPPPNYVLYATADWDDTGALNDSSHLVQLHGSFSLPILPVEISNETDPRRIRQTLQEQGWGPADHLIAIAHGHPAGMSLSTWSMLTTDSIKQDLHGIGELLRNVVDRKGTIIFDSCSTGKTGRESFAGAIYETTQRRVIAPDADTAIRQVWIEIDPATGRKIPKVRYREGNTIEFLPGPEVP